MDRRTTGTFKTQIRDKLEMYLSHPACDLEGELIDIHEVEEIEKLFESKFGENIGIYATCKLNPKLVERLNVTNAFAQCRDRGIISKSEYYFVKDKLTRVPKVWKKYGIPMLSVTFHYNRIMNAATEAMIPILYPRQWAIVEESKELVRA